MTDERPGEDIPQAGEPGWASQTGSGDATGAAAGAERRAEPGAPDPGSNQPTTEPAGQDVGQAAGPGAGQGDVSPGMGSHGSGHGSTGVGSGQPDTGDAGTAPPAAATGGEGASVGGGRAYRQAQHYGDSPEPIATDDEAGARATAPGGPVDARPAEPTSGDDADATGGLATDAMPGTSQAAPQAMGVRRAVYEEGSPGAESAERGGPTAPGGSGAASPINERVTGASDPGSAAAARGEAVQPAVEQPAEGRDDLPPTHERPVTGAHRPSAPSGEVGSQ